jgi:hypothetical protein
MLADLRGNNHHHLSLNHDSAGQHTWTCGEPEDNRSMTNTPSPDDSTGLTQVICMTVGKKHVSLGTTGPWPRCYRNLTRMGQTCVSDYFRSIAANALEYSRGSSHTYILELYVNIFKVHNISDIWLKIEQIDVTCFIISLFTAQHVSNVITSIFMSLRLIVELFHVLYCSGSMCVGVTVWFGWGGVVSLCRLKHCFSLHKDNTPPQPNHTVTPTHIEPEQYNKWNKSTLIRKLLKMDVLTFETCWAVNSEIIKQVTSSWSIFIQLPNDARSNKLKNLRYHSK